MTFLKKLLGLKVSNISGDLTSLYSIGNLNPPVFEVPLTISLGEYCLSIYNSITFKGFKDDNPAYQLKGLLLLSVFENDEEATFYFDGDVQVTVDLRPEGYSGPEAMTLTGPDDLIVVWN